MASHADEMKRFSTLAGLRPPRTAVAVGWMIGIAIPLVVLALLFVPWVQTAPGTGQVVAL